MNEYQLICSTISNKEARLKEIKQEAAEIESELNVLYQQQSEIFSDMMDKEDMIEQE